MLLLRGSLHSEQLKNTWLPLRLTNNYVTVLCMKINIWKTSRSYKKSHVNVMINISTRQELNQKQYQYLKSVLETVLYHLTHLCLLKILVQENHSVNFQRHSMSNIRLLFVGLVQLRSEANTLTLTLNLTLLLTSTFPSKYLKLHSST